MQRPSGRRAHGGHQQIQSKMLVCLENSKPEEHVKEGLGGPGVSDGTELRSPC